MKKSGFLGETINWVVKKLGGSLKIHGKTYFVKNVFSNIEQKHIFVILNKTNLQMSSSTSQK